ncbi:MAG: protein kinase, partial [Lachnospiraceae bacterium]|nr:protein kinase [Lachnospiraceae bacterium]
MLDEIYEPEQLPETITDEYKVLSTLSYSASKSVFLLEGKDDKKRCICKCRQSDKGMLLEAEYQYLMRLTENPEGQNLSCFPKVYAYFQEEGREYLIREYMNGVTLSSYLEEHGPCSVKEAIDILIPVCETIKVLHQQNPPLIHRDIKPDNILISEKNGKKSFHMIDLDTVREYKITSQRDTVFIGTVETAAPEQFGYQQTSIRTDIYSLGVLLVF